MLVAGFVTVTMVSVVMRAHLRGAASDDKLFANSRPHQSMIDGLDRLQRDTGEGTDARDIQPEFRKRVIICAAQMQKAGLVVRVDALASLWTAVWRGTLLLAPVLVGSHFLIPWAPWAANFDGRGCDRAAI